MELESYSTAVLRRSLRELLSPQSALWPEVKVFMAICKSARQRLPPEVQVWNMMNVTKGLNRLIRLAPVFAPVAAAAASSLVSAETPKEQHVLWNEGAQYGAEDKLSPAHVVELLRWIVERAELAGAYGLQRLRIGHQINWITSLLASLARIRQFAVEILDKLDQREKQLQRSNSERKGDAKPIREDETRTSTSNRTAASARGEPASSGDAAMLDEGVPLDRTTFARLKKKDSFQQDIPGASSARSTKQNSMATDTDQQLEKLPGEKSKRKLKKRKGSSDDHGDDGKSKSDETSGQAAGQRSKKAKSGRTKLGEAGSSDKGRPRNRVTATEPGTSGQGAVDDGDEEDGGGEGSAAGKHPQLVKLKIDLRSMMKGQPADVKASFKRLYSVVQKKSRAIEVNAGGDKADKALAKLCRQAIKKARSYCK